MVIKIENKIGFVNRETRGVFVKAKYVFLLIYGVAVCSLILSTLDNVLFASMLGDIKWIYIAFSIVSILAYTKVLNKKTLLCTTILLSYILLFGLVFVNDIVAEETQQYLAEMIIYFCLLYFTYLQIKQFKCFKEYIAVTYLAISVPLLFAYCTHFYDTTFNPLYFIKVLFFDLRRKSKFGFVQQNITAALCFLALLISIIYFYDYFSQNKQKKSISLFFIYVLTSDIAIWMMLQSTSSRAALTSLLLFIICLFFFFYIVPKRKLLLVCSLTAAVAIPVLLVFTGKSIWEKSNRTLNVTQNLQWVEVVGNRWTGMGFVQTSAFQFHYGSESAFGVQTSSLDIYYLYLYCTTGIVGCVMMGGLILMIGVFIFKHRKEHYGLLMISMYICMLYYAIWECVFFTFHFWSFFIIFAILWCFIDGTAQRDFLDITAKI